MSYAQTVAVSNAALRYADFLTFTAMVRGSAKLRDSILVARGLEPIGLPHINDNVKRGHVRTTQSGRTCSCCGFAVNDRKNKSGLCLTCYKAAQRAKVKRCEMCDTLLSRKNRSGRCMDHRGPLREAKPNAIVREMLGKTAPLFKVAVQDILSQARKPDALHARCVVAVALRRRGYSLPQIGQRLGRDHSSIKHLIENLPKYAMRDPLVTEALEALA
jgi:hypothetical protein